MWSDPPTGAVLALDIGGTKIAAALVGFDGTLQRVVRAPTPSTSDPAALFDVVLAVMRDVTGYAAVSGIGVGCGGPMIWPAGVVSPLNIPAWRDFPLRAALAQAYPAIPIRIHNDAICVAIAEHWRGCAVGSANVLGMVVSTGVGGGLILDGRLIVGATGNAGHIGHVVVDPAEAPCACGGHGCLEAIASGSRLVAWALDHGWVPGDGAVADGPSLERDARAGDPIAARTFARAGHALGVAIASTVALTDLEVVAVGGGLAAAGELLFDPLQAAYHRHAGLSYARRPRVFPATFGTSAGLVGAAALVLAGQAYWSAD